MTRGQPQDVRPMPSWVEGERALLGSIIQRPEILDTCSLQPRDFYDAANGRIYALLRQMRRAGEPVDPVTVPERAVAVDVARFGGMVYVMELPDHAVSPTNWTHYAQEVAGLARRRRLIAHHLAAVEAAHDRTRTMDELIAEARATLEEASTFEGDAHWTWLGDHVWEQLDALEARQRGESVLGHPTGLESLDERVSMCPGDLVIVAGRPSMGKTALALQLVEGLAESSGLVAGIQSLEMMTGQLVDRMLVRRSGVPNQIVRRGSMTVADWDDMNRAAREIDDMRICVDDRAGLTLDQLRTGAIRLHRQHGGMACYAVDYLQLVRTEGRRGESHTVAVGRVSTGLKALAKDLECPVLALSQLSRECEKRSDKRPMMSDLRDSGQLEQDADTILFLYRDEVYNPQTRDEGVCEVIIAKGRNEGTGMVPLHWDGDRQRFRSPNPDWTRQWLRMRGDL